jgi:ABC-type amino acid transport substrate-binding protein
MAVLVVLLAWCSSVGRQDAWGHQTTHPSEDVARPSVAEEPGTRMPLPPLRIRGDWNYPPFEFLDAQGQPDGFNIDIVRAVARVMNLEITVDLGPWDEVRRQLETGAIDALAGMFRTPERDRRVDFTIPHLIVSYAVFVRQDSPVQSL